MQKKIVLKEIRWEGDWEAEQKDKGVKSYKTDSSKSVVTK